MRKLIIIALMLVACLAMGQDFFRRRTVVRSAVVFNEYSLSFDGDDDWVNCPTNNKLVNTSNLTIMGWIYPISPSGFENIYWEGSGAPTAFMRLYFWNGAGFKPIFEWRNSAHVVQAITSTVAFANGKWTHIAVTKDASNGRADMYTNGVLVASSVGTLDYTATPTNPPLVAFSYSSTVELNANLDEWQGYTRPLSSGEVWEVYNNGNGTYWTNNGVFVSSGIPYTNSIKFSYHFDEGAGTNQVDDSGNGYNATSIGATYVMGKVVKP